MTNKNKETKKKTRKELIGIVKGDISKSLDGNGGETAVLDPQTVTAFINVKHQTCVWNGTGVRPDDSTQPLNGGQPLRAKNAKGKLASFFSIASIKAKIGNGEKITKKDIL